MSDTASPPNDSSPVHPLPAPRPFTLSGLIRTPIAGVLMGLANIIPGVSGGTMILALGLYEEFIGAVADLTALRFSLRRLVFLGVLIVFALGAIVGLSGVMLGLLLHYPVAMFALFIGLTLGGVPLLVHALRPVAVGPVVALVLGFVAVVGIGKLEWFIDEMPRNTGMDVVSGVVGSTTMVLPGISGSYMLLILDQYERVVGAVSDFKDAISDRDGDALKAALWVVVPVGLGAVVGIIVLSNGLKWLLRHYHRTTLGCLLGILLGSVVGLWPFDRVPAEKALEELAETDAAALREFAAVRQVPGLDGVTDEGLVGHIRASWGEREGSDLTPGNAVLAGGLVIVGFGMTYGLSRLRRPEERPGAHRGGRGVD
jgi:putative membrane protein